MPPKGDTTNAKTRKTLAGRLARRKRNTKTKRLSNRTQRQKVHGRDAGKITRNKKRPSLASARKLAQAWAGGRKENRAVAPVIREFCEEIAAQTLDQLTAETPRRLVARWQAEGYSQHYLHQKAMMLRAMLKHLIACGAPPRVLEFPRVRGGKPREFVATVDELNALIAIAPLVAPWMPCWLAIAAGHGLRFAEVRRLAEIHFDKNTGVIHFPAKGATTNTLPATEELKHFFETAPPSRDPRQPLIERFAGTTLSQGQIRRAWKRMLSMTGTNPNLNPHDLRRTLAVRTYDLTKDLRIAQQVLGHSSIATTATYLAHRDPGQLRGLLEGLSQGKPKTAGGQSERYQN
jgi:integrase